MAIIICPECGKEISDKVTTCPNCGFPFEKENLNNIEQMSQSGEAAEVKPKGFSKKKLAIIAGAAILVIIIAIIALRITSKNSYNTYIDNVNLTVIAILNGGSEAEKLCNDTLNVWYNAIFKKDDVSTDAFTKPNGTFVSDFNVALGNFFQNPDTKTTISDIKSNKISVEDLMKKLKNPPKDLETCYATLSDLYAEYQALTNAAINPSGSYTDFKTTKNTAVSNFLSTYNKLKTQIPDKIK